MTDASADLVHEETAPTTVQKLLAEGIGTAVLVLIGCGSVALAGNGDGFGSANIVSVGLAFGLAVTVMAYALGRISGGHFNPAVSVAAAVSGRLSWKEAGTYAAAQVVGGIVGAALLLALALGTESFDAFDKGSGSLGANGWGDDGTGYALWAALLLELVLTLVFVFVILAVTDRRNEHAAFAPLAIGLTLAIIHFVAVPLTGTSVNPARSIGPALFSGTDAIIQLWVFIVAPLLGGLAGGLLYPLVYGRDADPVAGSGLDFSSGKPAPTGPAGYGEQWGQPGGYQAPGQQAPVQQAEAPIIQDGWQWDPQANQWIPAQPQPGQDWQGGSTQIRGPQG